MTPRAAYGKFLQSAFWKRLTAAKKRSVGGACERCGFKRNLQSHHKQYPEDWFDTKLEDLEVLCGGCHDREHGVQKQRGFYDEDPDIDNFFFGVQAVHRLMGVGIMPNRRVKKWIRRHMERYRDDVRVQFHARQVFKFYRVMEVCYP